MTYMEINSAARQTFKGRFNGRRAIITGGASGLGKAVAARIVAEGGDVVLWDFSANLGDSEKEIGAKGAFTVDVSNAEAVSTAAKQSREILGGIDILVNSAGITGATVPLWEFPVDSWQRVMDINLNGLFYCCREVTPYMLEGGYGRVANIASVAGKEGNPNASAYSASKAGVVGLTKSLGKELATKGVIVNVLTPATFESPILSQLPPAQVDYMRSKIPMGRLGIVDESAAMVCFMVSEECSFTTASVFDTSGGRTTY